MPQITSIKPQKRPDRFNIFLDDKFAFSVSSQNLLIYKLRVGKSLSEKEIAKIIKEESFAKFFNLSLKFVSFRARSQKEVEDYLAQKIAKAENLKFHLARQSLLISQIINKLKKLKVLNDREFASWLVTSRLRQFKGSRLIKMELLKKGLPNQIIESQLKNLPSPSSLAKKAIEKKLTSWQKLPPLAFKRKIYRHLLSRGFDYEVVKDIFAFLEKRR